MLGPVHTFYSARPYTSQFEDEDTAKLKELDIDVSGSGRVTSKTGIISAIAGLPSLIKRAKIAFNGNSLESKIIAIQDIINVPLKVIISSSSGVNALNALIKVGCIATALSVLLITSSIYLVLELMMSILVLVKSINFDKKEKIIELLSTIKNLDHEINRLESLPLPIQEKSQSETLRLRQAKAYLLTNRIKRLKEYQKDERQLIYLTRRIGITATDGFIKASKHINLYEKETIIEMSTEELIEFNKKGETLLTMVEHHRAKALHVHIFSLAVIAIFTISMLFTTKVLPTTNSLIGAFASGGSTSASLTRSFLDDGYINNTGKGFSLRLAIPKVLAPEEGESTLSIWRSFDAKLKPLYIFLSVISLGLFYVFDAHIFKSQWIKNLRGNGDQFDQKNALYHEHDFTIPAPVLEFQDMSDSDTESYDELDTLDLFCPSEHLYTPKTIVELQDMPPYEIKKYDDMSNQPHDPYFDY
ncbi:MAG: hypothetical protein S4CHLAM20_14590 [Chlamydiia bacterium]|nr:hypothetical protein [Chlamydiia bacterium]